MTTEVTPHQPPNGPFNFQFSIPPANKPKRTITREPSLLDPSPSLSSRDYIGGENGTGTGSYQIAPIQRLPAEIHTLIASYLPLPSIIIRLAWTCRRLYASLGPTNRLLWHELLYRRRKQENPRASIPPFSPEENYYQKCLDIMCNRTPKGGCQRCLIFDEGMYVGHGHAVHGITGVRSTTAKNEEKWSHLVEIYVAKIYCGTWCWDCTKEVYESIAIVKLVTPIPEVPPTLFTEIRQHPCGHRKPGLFVSRAAIAAAIKEQCPNGGYHPFNIDQHAEPDIREAKPYVMNTILRLYKTNYKHLHILFSPGELGMNIKKCLDIKKFNVAVASATTIQNELVDAVFGVARRYLSSKEIEGADEEEMEKERIKSCERFLMMFFGSPNPDGACKNFKIRVPTTRFLAFIGKRYWLTRMEEMGRDLSAEPKGNKIKYCVEDKPRKRCGVCVGKCSTGNPESVRETYSPVLMVYHMISEHADLMGEEWPEVPDLKPVKKEVKEAKAVSKVEGLGYDGEEVGDIRFLFDATDDVDLARECDSEEAEKVVDEVVVPLPEEPVLAVKAVDDKVGSVETAQIESTNEVSIDADIKNLFISSESSSSESEAQQ
ncbi:hypothetical protein TWF730_008953 [Orbilia blumenaviensis]|uniref:F-box domain-containing protein n=1 Tax=Orbilia blumenaviensis TaxID=1796055 RepID=A0AAV9V090_9PEZI